MSDPSPADDDLASTLIGAVTRPLPTFERVAERGSLLPSLVAVTAAGLAWAALCGVLGVRGHQPSFTGNPIPAEHYYYAQALFITPLLLCGWWLLGGVGHTTARLLGGEGTLRATWSTTGLGYGLPILLLFVVPDLLVFLVGGFSELGFAIRLSGPLCALWVWVMTAAAMRAAHGLPWWRALMAALAAVIVQGILVGGLAR